MIIHRAIRDIQKCRAKYGKAWEEYERRVPYLFIPVSLVSHLVFLATADNGSSMYSDLFAQVASDLQNFCVNTKKSIVQYQFLF